MIAYYLMPVSGTGTAENPRTVKYADEMDNWSALDYGNEPIMLVRAGVTAAQHTSISSNADVLSAPDILTNTVGAALAQVQSKLENINIHSQWITSGMQWRTVIRGIAIMFLLAQRMQGRGLATLFPAGVTLNSTFSSLPLAIRTHLIDMSDSFYFDRTGITGSTTVRQILLALANQYRDNVKIGTDYL